LTDKKKQKQKKNKKKQKKQQISEWKVDLYIDNLSESDVIKIQIEICFVNRWTFPYNFVFCCTGRGKTYFKDCLVNRREYVTILGLFVSRCELAAEPYPFMVLFILFFFVYDPQKKKKKKGP
jgi:hypothetical protein